MSQDRYHRPQGLNTGSLGISVGITGAMIAGLIFAAAPSIIRRPPETHLTIRNIDLLPPPQLDPTPPPPKQVQQRPIVSPTPLVRPTTSPTPVLAPLAPIELGPVLPPTGTGPGPIASSSPAAEPTVPPAPVLVDAQVDPRYAAALQPPYPAEERRAEHQGRVVVRVLIGVDGRVKQVERRSADSDAFYRETERQALGKWRFKPATRDGIPVEAWRTMAIRFVLQDG